MTTTHPPMIRPRHRSHGGSNAELQDLTNRLVDRARAYGMEVSTEKSKIMTNNTNNISADISMSVQKLEEVTCFEHLCKDGSSSTFTCPLTTGVVGAPQMTSQPVSLIFCSLLPSGTWRTPGLSFPWCCLPASVSVCLVFFILSLCLARLFRPDLINKRHVQTTSVCVFLRWSGDLRVIKLSAGSWHRLPRW